MRDGGDRREPLWASSLADQRPNDDVTVHVVREEPEERPRTRTRRPRPAPAPAPREAQPVSQRALAVGLLLALLVVGLASAIASRGGSFAVEDVPSFWGEVPMTCHTARFEQDGGAFELFRCTPLGGRLPPGDYRSPGSQWTSDITRRDATANVIRISPDNTLVGWAGY